MVPMMFMFAPSSLERSLYVKRRAGPARARGTPPATRRPRSAPPDGGCRSGVAPPGVRRPARPPAAPADAGTRPDGRSGACRRVPPRSPGGRAGPRGPFAGSRPPARGALHPCPLMYLHGYVTARVRKAHDGTTDTQEDRSAEVGQGALGLGEPGAARVEGLAGLARLLVVALLGGLGQPRLQVGDRGAQLLDRRLGAGPGLGV